MADYEYHKNILDTNLARLEIKRHLLIRLLKTVLHKMKNSRFTLVFMDCYFLMGKKEYCTNVKHRPKGSNLFTEATQLSLLWQR